MKGKVLMTQDIKIVDVVSGSIWGAKAPERKKSLGLFKDLDIFIQSHSKCADDHKYYTHEINQHLAGIIKYEELSDTAQLIWDEYEQYMCEQDNLKGT
jgi:hypothetical protein